MRLEDSKFRGTNDCNYADDQKGKTKQILGIQEKIDYEQNRNTI